MKKIRHILEAALAQFAFFIFGILPFNIASALGGAITRLLGPILPVTKIAQQNIKNAMPELDDNEIKEIIKNMWDNLGRTVAEFPHVYKLSNEDFIKRVTVIGKENADAANKQNKGFIFFSGHFANWEVAPKTAHEIGYTSSLVYRKSNNPYVDSLINKTRKPGTKGLFPKGRSGVRDILAHLKNGGYLGMLVDQKMNDGIPVKFFGRNAMTAPAIAEFGIKLGLPLIPARVERVEKTKFIVTMFPPLITEGKTTSEIMLQANLLFEKWIRQRPEQWLWLHKRWPG